MTYPRHQDQQQKNCFASGFAMQWRNDVPASLLCSALYCASLSSWLFLMFAFGHAHFHTCLQCNCTMLTHTPGPPKCCISSSKKLAGRDKAVILCDSASLAATHSGTSGLSASAESIPHFLACRQFRSGTWVTKKWCYFGKHAACSVL